VPFGQKKAVSEDLVAVHDLDVRYPLNDRAHGQEIVVVRGPFEFAIDIDDDQEMTRVLDFAIGDSALAQ